MILLERFKQRYYFFLKVGLKSAIKCCKKILWVFNVGRLPMAVLCGKM